MKKQELEQRKMNSELIVYASYGSLQGNSFVLLSKTTNLLNKYLQEVARHSLLAAIFYYDIPKQNMEFMKHYKTKF